MQIRRSRPAAAAGDGRATGLPSSPDGTPCISADSPTRVDPPGRLRGGRRDGGPRRSVSHAPRQGRGLPGRHRTVDADGGLWRCEWKAAASYAMVPMASSNRTAVVAPVSAETFPAFWWHCPATVCSSAAPHRPVRRGAHRSSRWRGGIPPFSSRAAVACPRIAFVDPPSRLSGRAVAETVADPAPPPLRHAGRRPCRRGIHPGQRRRPDAERHQPGWHRHGDHVPRRQGAVATSCSGFA